MKKNNYPEVQRAEGPSPQPDDASEPGKNVKTQSSLKRIIAHLRQDYQSPREAAEQALTLNPPAPTFDPLAKLRKKRNEFDDFIL